MSVEDDYLHISPTRMDGITSKLQILAPGSSPTAEYDPELPWGPGNGYQLVLVNNSTVVPLPKACRQIYVAALNGTTPETVLTKHVELEGNTITGYPLLPGRHSQRWTHVIGNGWTIPSGTEVWIEF